jgi:hypothetical protein
VNIDDAGDQSNYSDQSDYANFLAVCGFSVIGLLLSVRMLLELAP